MKTLRVRLLIAGGVTAVLLVALLLSFALAQPATFFNKRLTADSVEEQYPAIWDDTVVYEHRTPDDIGVYDLDTGTASQIGTASAGEYEPDIWEDRVVYRSYRWGGAEIGLWDLGTGIETRITSDTVYSQNPAIYSDKIVYRNRIGQGGSEEIVAYDIVSQVESRLTSNTVYESPPDIWGDRVVYARTNPGNNDIFMYDLSSSTESTITSDTAQQTSPRIWGDKIVYTDNRHTNQDIYMFDLATMTESRITSDTANQAWPVVFGDYVYWEDRRNGGTSPEIYGMYLPTMAEFRLTYSGGNAQWADAYGMTVVWEDTRNYGATKRDVWGARPDSQPPTTTISAIPAGWQTAPIKFTLSATDDWSDVDDSYYEFNGGTTQVYSSEVTLSDEGETTIKYWSEDNATNVEPWSSELAKIDMTDPMTKSDTKSEYEDSAKITLTVSDLHSGPDKTYYMLDGGAKSEYTAPIEVTELGEHTLKFWSTDVAGNEETHHTDSFEIVAAIGPYTPVEIAGATRYETAIEASMEAFPNGLTADSDGRKTVVVATGENWPDALGGAALAGAYDGPILLTPAAGLPQSVMDEIARLGATDAFILGGTGAVSPAVETQLAAELGATKVVRVGGSDRYVTAELIARAVAAATDTEFDGTAFVATGLNFPDALAGSPLSAAGDWPIVLAPEAGMRASTVAAMADIGVDEVLLLGGTAVVSQTIEDALAGALGAGNVTRLAGATRYETAIAVATHGVDEAGLEWNRLALATGENFPDALAGGVLQGQSGSVMLLTHTASLTPSTAATLEANTDMIGTVRFLGGTGAVSQTVRDQVAQILE